MVIINEPRIGRDLEGAVLFCLLESLLRIMKTGGREFKEKKFSKSTVNSDVINHKGFVGWMGMDGWTVSEAHSAFITLYVMGDHF